MFWERDLIATDLGTVLVTHGPAACLPPCPIHAPTDHHMRTWPMDWNRDERLLLRLCPHMVQHPDPDDIAFDGAWSPEERHPGCDGCCTPPAG